MALHGRILSPPRRSGRPRSLRQLGHDGFTIVEVALAAFVMALGISSSIIALQWGFRFLDVARGTTLASQIMQSEIERLRLWPWEKTSPSSVIDSIVELPASEEVPLAGMFSASAALEERFTVTRTVTTDATRADVRFITVAVTWTTSDGQSHTRSSTTMYARNGLYDYYYTLAGGS